MIKLFKIVPSSVRGIALVYTGISWSCAAEDSQLDMTEPDVRTLGQTQLSLFSWQGMCNK